VWAAAAVCSRRYAQRGGDRGLITTIALWAVPGGLIGARLYHVVTEGTPFRRIACLTV
jgi:prolipoprotein diacylglyceryltransferase